MKWSLQQLLKINKFPYFFEETLDLSVKNPNKKEEKILREPSEIIAEMQQLNKQSQDILKDLM